MMPSSSCRRTRTLPETWRRRSLHQACGSRCDLPAAHVHGRCLGDRRSRAVRHRVHARLSTSAWRRRARRRVPAQLLMEAALRRTVGLRCLEDNTQCIAAVNNGYSAVLRSLPRTERIALSVAHEVFIETAENALIYEETSLHRGDMFTKRLAAPAFEDAIARIGMRRMV